MMIRKIIIWIIIIYLSLAMINVVVTGWEGVGSFLVGPVDMIEGIIDGTKTGLEKAPASFQQGREEAKKRLQDNG